MRSRRRSGWGCTLSVLHPARPLRVSPSLAEGSGDPWTSRLMGSFATVFRMLPTIRWTWMADHRPPRAASIFCRFSSAAIARSEVAPPWRMFSMTGINSSRRFAALAERTAAPTALPLRLRAAKSLAGPRRPPSFCSRAKAFFGEGYWKDKNRWPWREGMAPEANGRYRELTLD